MLLSSQWLTRQSLLCIQVLYPFLAWPADGLPISVSPRNQVMSVNISKNVYHYINKKQQNIVLTTNKITSVCISIICSLLQKNILTITHSINSSHLRLLPKQFIFDSSLFFFSHPFLMLFEVFPFPSLQVEPCVGEGTDLGQQSLNKWMKLILHVKQTDKHKHIIWYTQWSITKPI